MAGGRTQQNWDTGRCRVRCCSTRVLPRFPLEKRTLQVFLVFFFWKNAVSSAVTFRRVPFRFPSSIEWIEWSGLFFFLSFHFVRDASEKAFLFSLHVTAFLHSFQVDSSKSDVSSKQFFICALSKFSC